MLASKRIYLRNVSENDAPILLKWGKDKVIMIVLVLVAMRI